MNLSVSAQRKEKVEVVPTISRETLADKCKNFTLGSLTLFLQPEYPPEAKTAQIGGTVTVYFSINETGKISEIKSIDGNKILQSAVLNAVQKVKFTPTICDGVPKKVGGLLTYNFVPYVLPKAILSRKKSKNLPT